ncbi:CBS domain-containing protein [Sporolactobacillus sp. THM19-2]|nr:CBS domain-containing protein [Sporolactobacillus sp. THM19-2]
MTHTLKDIMSHDVICCRPGQTLKEAAELMSHHHIGSIPVVDNDHTLLGVITDRDMTLRSTARGKDGDQVHVEKCMTRDHLISGTPDMDIHEASRLMSEHQIRRLPVVDQGKLIGYVALGDLADRDHYRDEAEAALSGISSSR